MADLPARGRRAVVLSWPWRLGGHGVPAAPVEEILGHIRNIPLGGVVLIGYVIPAIVLWMMVFRPG